MHTKRTAFEKPVTDFLNSYPNKKTRENYRLAITHFLHAFCKSSRSGKFARPDILAWRYFDDIENERRDYYRDCKKFALILNDKYAPTTTRLYLSLATLWLDENGYRLSRREHVRLTAQLPPPQPESKETEIKRGTFRLLYHALPYDTAVLLLVQTASGMRLSEALSLKKTDLDWSGERVEITVPADISKTKLARTTYLTTEAAISLLEYLRSRKDESDQLFLVSYDQAQRHMRNTARDMGLVTTINGRTCCEIHWHMARKWFISRFSLAASRDVAEHLAGHEGYLSRAYRRYTKKQLLKEYAKAEKKLTVLKDYEY